MRIIAVTMLLLALAIPAAAVQPQFWKTASAEEFFAGELEGMVVTSRGELRPGPGVEKLGAVSDPFVLSQVADGSGARYLGTGNEGKVYRLAGKELKLLYTAPEPEIYALAYANGALFVGSSPNGKVYRVDPASGKATVYYDPQQAYIWALEPLGDGSLAVATGIEGKLFKVTGAGKGSLLFDAPELHLRSIARASNGRLIAGGSGEGRIYEIGADGKGHALYDSSLPEISSIWFDAKSGVAWASGVGNIAPTSAPAKTDAQKGSGSSSGDAAKKQQDQHEGQATVSVEVGYSFDDGQPSSAVPSAGSELYRIESDGFVQTARKFDRETIYALGGDGNGGVLLSTGPNGRVYRFAEDELALIASVPEKQVVSFSNEGGAPVVTTTNSGAVYRLGSQGGSAAEYKSIVKDTVRFSRFGEYEIQGSGLDNNAVTISFRSGNSATPDETWSEWSSARGPRGAVAAPPARYIQWKIDASKPVVVSSVSLAYINRNAAPVIDNVSVLEPGAVIVSSQYPSNAQVLEATNPDEYGIFSSLDTPRNQNDPGKRMFRRGYRTIVWKARDDNGDLLRYDVSFRRAGSSEWLRLRENVEESQINFDTSQLPDGTYEVQVVARDDRENPELPLRDVDEGVEFVVDNSVPRIEIAESGSDYTVRITDALSSIGKVEYSVDAKKWERLLPVDGIADSPDEQFRIPKSAVGNGFLVIRAVDQQYNVATSTLR